MDRDELDQRLSRMSTVWTMVFEAHGGEADAATAAMSGLAPAVFGSGLPLPFSQSAAAAQNWTDNVFRSPAPCAHRSDRRSVERSPCAFGLISAGRMPKLEFRPRLSVWWALPANFVQLGFQEIRPVPIPDRLGHRTPPSTTPQHARNLPGRADSHDRVPVFRCHAMPGGDKL